MSSNSSSNVPSGGGKIIAQNRAYLEMLREGTYEREDSLEYQNRKKTNRVYVDSPVFTKEDEEKYRFVSTDADSLSDDLADSLDVNETEPASVNTMLLLKPVSPNNWYKTQAKQEAQDNYTVLNNNNLTNDTKSENKTILKPTKGQQRVWNSLEKDYDYKVRTGVLETPRSNNNSNNEVAAAPSQPKSVDFDGDHSKPALEHNDKNKQFKQSHGDGYEPPHPGLGSKMITPIENPLKPFSKEQTDDLRLLAEEKKYQEELWQRISSNEHVPRLNLTEVISDDDDEKKRKADPRDSLDSDQDDNNEEEWNKPKQVYSNHDPQDPNKVETAELKLKFLELQQRLEQLETQKSHEQLVLQQHSAVPLLKGDAPSSQPSSVRKMTSADIKNLQNPSLKNRYEFIAEEPPTIHNQQPVVYKGNLPINFAAVGEDDNPFQSPVVAQGNNSSVPFTRHPQAQPQIVQQVPQDQRYEQPLSAPTQSYHQPTQQGLYQQYPGLTVYPSRGLQYPVHSIPVAGQPYQVQDYQVVGQPYEVQDYQEQDIQLDSSKAAEKDFIVLNKRAIHEETHSAKTYGKLYNRKKEHHAQPSPVPAPRKVKSHRPAPPAVDFVTGDVTHHPSQPVHDNASSAEKLWARRAQTLMSKQGQSVSSAPVTGKSGMRKAQSDGRIYNKKDGPTVASQTQPIPKVAGHFTQVHVPPRQGAQGHSVQYYPHPTGGFYDYHHGPPPAQVKDLNYGTSPHPPFVAPVQHSVPLSPHLAHGYLQYGVPQQHAFSTSEASSASSIGRDYAHGYNPPQDARFYVGNGSVSPILPGQTGPLRMIQQNRQPFTRYPMQKPGGHPNQQADYGADEQILYTDPNAYNTVPSSGYTYGRTGDYEDFSPTPTSSMSPYKVVPPIGSAGHKDYYPNDEVLVDAGGSYVQTFEKNKQKKFDYKPYGMSDYKKLKKEVKLGGLGPDLDNDDLREKKEKRQKQLQYGRAMNDKNRSTYSYGLQKSKREEDDSLNSENDLLDKRKLALEYAKTVPKPKVKPRRNSLDESETQPAVVPQVQARNQVYRFVPANFTTNTMKTTTTLRPYQQQPADSQFNSSNNQSALGHLSPTAERQTVDMFDLEALQQRHQQEREKVALIKQNIQA